MTNEEMKKEVLLRANRLKERRAKRRKRLLTGGACLLFVALLATAVPPLLRQPSPAVTPPSDQHRTTTTVSPPSTTATTATTQTQTTTQTRILHSQKGPTRTTAPNAVTPQPDSTIRWNGNAVYRVATDEERIRYGVPTTIPDEALGEWLGNVTAQADGTVVSSDPALLGCKVYVYAPIAEYKVLIVVCGAERYAYVCV